MEQKYNVIYVMSVDYPQLKGIVKIGQASIALDVDPSSIADNDEKMMQAIRDDMKQMEERTGCNMPYQIDYCTIGINNKTHQNISNIDVHQYLRGKGVLPVQPTMMNGWYRLPVNMAVLSINDVKNK